MQLWFPSSLAEPLSPSLRDQQHSVSTDPELEFDREVYPIGISISEVAIIGGSLSLHCCLVVKLGLPIVRYTWQKQMHRLQNHVLAVP